MLIADENFIEDRAGLLCDGAIQPVWPSLEVLNQSLVSDCELSFFVTLIHSGFLAPVVQTLDSAIHWINHYPLDNSVGFASVYPLNSDLSSG